MDNVRSFKTYKKELHCMNCNQMATEEIPWGQIADVKEKPCPKCGVSANKFTEYLESNRLKAHPHGEISELAEAVIKLANSIAELKPLDKEFIASNTSKGLKKCAICKQLSDVVLEDGDQCHSCISGN